MLIVYGLTFDHTTNYGSCFQAYALQQAIEKITVKGEKCSYYLIPIRTFMNIPVDNFIMKVKWTLRKPFVFLQRYKFALFEKKYMKYVNCHQMEDLPLLNEKADAFVCGSDVIWNTDLNYKIGAFFLDFATKYKFSYAASFGKAEIKKDALTFAGEKLKSFDAISVRENTSLRIVNTCSDKEVKIVADPVILLDTEEWKSIMSKSSMHNKYIFAYTTHMNNTFKNFLQTLKKLTGLQIVVSIWSLSVKQALKQRKVSGQAPQEWLSLLHGAEYVVTNSFHATVFSTLFHKKFFTVVSGDKAKGINMRMNDFLNAVGLGNRIYSSVPDTIDLSAIDYNNVDEKIALMRAKSLEYLKRNLEEAYKRKTHR